MKQADYYVQLKPFAKCQKQSRCTFPIIGEQMKVFRIIDSFEPKTRWYLRGPKECEGGSVPSQQGSPELWGKEVEGWHFTGGTKYETDATLAIPIQQGTVVLDFTLQAIS